MICACLPALRHLLIHIWPRIFLLSMKISEEKKSSLPSLDGISGKQSDQLFNGDIQSSYDLSLKLSANVHIVEEERQDVSVLQKPLSSV